MRRRPAPRPRRTDRELAVLAMKLAAGAMATVTASIPVVLQLCKVMHGHA